jgi:hypothetical protein
MKLHCTALQKGIRHTLFWRLLQLQPLEAAHSRCISKERMKSLTNSEAQAAC